MEPEQSAYPPINQIPSSPQQVEPNTALRKKWWVIIGSVLAILLLLVGLYMWQAQAAKNSYTSAVARYKNDIKTERDALNEELDSKDIGGRQAKAKPLFEDHGKKLEAIVAAAPIQPKIFGFTPVNVDTTAANEQERLTQAASNYAKALRHDYEVYNFFVVASDNFKPIKELGTITALDEDKLKKIGNELWPAYIEAFRNLQPPSGLETMHTDVLKQLQEIGETFKRLANEYDSFTIQQVDQTIIALRPHTNKIGTDIASAVDAESVRAYDDINAKYDELDALLK